jgi:hypothetical protein
MISKNKHVFDLNTNLKLVKHSKYQKFSMKVITIKLKN